MSHKWLWRALGIVALAWWRYQAMKIQFTKTEALRLEAQLRDAMRKVDAMQTAATSASPDGEARHQSQKEIVTQ